MKELLRKKGRVLRRDSLTFAMLVFELILFVIVLLLGIRLYGQYRGQIYDNFVDSNVSVLDSVVNRNENEMSVMNTVVSQIAITPEARDFLLEEKPKRAEQLIQRLSEYSAVSSSFSMILYVNHNDHYVCNQRSSAEIDLFLRKGLLLEDTPASKFRKYLYDSSKKMIVLPEQGISGYFIQTMTFSERASLLLMTVQPDKEYTILFVLPEEYYDSILTAAEDDPRLTLIGYQGIIVAQRSSLDLSGEQAAETLVHSGDGNGQLEIGGEKYLALRQTGASGLTYLTLQPLSVYRKNLSSGAWPVLLLVLLCFVPASIVILLVGRHYTEKFRTVNTMLRGEDSDSLGSLESDVRTLLEEKQENEQDSLALRRTRFVNRFICGEFSSEEEMREAARRAKLQAERPLFLVVMMAERGNGNEQRAAAQVLQALAEEVNVDGYAVRMIQHARSLLLLFCESREETLAFLEKTFGIVKANGEDAIMAASDFHGSFREAPQAYLEADTAYDNRLLLDNSRIIYYSQLDAGKPRTSLPDRYLQQLRNAIHRGDSAETERVIDEICEKLRDDNSLMGARMICNDILQVLAAEWNEAHDSKVYNVYTLSECLSIRDFHDVLSELCGRLIAGKTDPDVSEHARTISLACSRMQEDYGSPDTTIGSIASDLGISAVTLSVEFKNVMGISPSDYLTSIRMEKAKELIRTTGMKIREISAAVGYEDDHVFTRRFKVYTGRTPSQYRAERSGKTDSAKTDIGSGDGVKADSGKPDSGGEDSGKSDSTERRKPDR